MNSKPPARERRYGAAKTIVLRQLRRRALQPLWDRLGHLARIGQNYWATELEQSGELAVLDQLKPHLTFDVGANVGTFAKAASRYGLVYGFEPSSAAFAKIPSHENIRPFNFALSASKGTATLHGSGDTIASLIEQPDPRRPLTVTEQVYVETLDSFCDANGIDRIDLLKIDTEGYELEVLKGAARMLPRIRHVQFEFGHFHSRVLLKDFFDLMPGRQFYRIVSDGLWPIKYREELEGGATINYLASLA